MCLGSSTSARSCRALSRTTRSTCCSWSPTAARAALGIEEEVEQGVRIPLGAGFAGRVAAEARPLVIDVDQYGVYNPILRQKGIKSMLGVPLIVQGVSLGVLHVGTLRPRVFTRDEVDLLQLVAERV